MKPEDIPTRNNPEEYIKYKEYLMDNIIDIFKRKEDKAYELVVELLEIYKSV